MRFGGGSIEGPSGRQNSQRRAQLSCVLALVLGGATLATGDAVFADDRANNYYR